MKPILMLLILSLAVFGQASRNRTPGSSSVWQGATLPSTCRISPEAEEFYKSGTSAGLYVCTATNTWTLIGPGASGPPSGAAGGKLSGTYPNPGVNLQSADIPNNAADTSGKATTAGTADTSVATTDTTVVRGAASLTGSGALLLDSAAGTAGKLETNLVFASSIPGIHLNGSLTANTGTDDKAALQAVLNTATAATPLLLVMDGVAAIDSTTTGLVVKSFTEIKCLGWSTGFSWLGSAAAGQVSMITNANPLGIATPVDSSISIRGCQFNGNHDSGHGGVSYYYNSAGIFFGTVKLVGVDGLVIDNVKTTNAPGFGIWLANVKNFSISNIRVDHRPALGAAGDASDGIHINGPATNGRIALVSGGSYDDLLALNADDGHLAESLMASGGFGDLALASTVKSGPITNVVVDGLYPENCFEAFRLLSATSLMDGIEIRNVKGTTTNYMFAASLFPAAFAGIHRGNFGRIVLDNIDLISSGTYPIILDAAFRSLKLGLVVHDWTIAYPVLATSHYTKIQDLAITLTSDSEAGLSAEIIKINGGWIKSLRLSGKHSSGVLSVTPVVSTYPIINAVAGYIGDLQVSNFYAEDVNNVVVVNGGVIDTLTFGTGRHLRAGTSEGTVSVATSNTISKAVVSGFATKLFMSGAGTITTYYSGINTDTPANPVPWIYDGLVASWPLTEATGGSRVDVTGNAHTLADVGTVPQVGAANGQVGSAASFANDDTKYLRATAGTSFNPIPGFTFSLWVNFSAISAQQSIFGKYTFPADEASLYYLTGGTNKLTLIVATGVLSIAPQSPSINTWYFVSGGYDPAATGAEIFMSVNNAADSTHAITGVVTNTGAYLTVGNHPLLGAPMNGKVAHFNWWNRVLTASERTAVYNAGVFCDPF